MKIKLLLGIISLLVISTVSAQEETFLVDQKIVYKMMAQTDSTDAGSVTERNWHLLVGGDRSLFLEEKLFQSDSTLYHHHPEQANTIPPGGTAFSVVNKFRYKIVKSPELVTVYDEVIGKEASGYIPLYKYTEPKDAVEWELQAETDSIGGFLCQRAETTYGGRRWIAYFTPDIPINDGPYKFSGLPGLILRVYDSEGYWSFDMISTENLAPAKTVVINFQKAFALHEGSKADFFLMRREHQIRLPDIFSAAMPNGLDENMRAMYNKRLEADNNWIELIP